MDGVDAAAVIIADRQAVTRIGLVALMEGRHVDMVCVDSKAELVDALMLRRNVVVWLDYAIFDIGSVDSLLIMMSRFSMARWVMWSSEFNPGFVRRLSDCDKVSFVEKTADIDELNHAVESTLAGKNVRSHVADIIVRHGNKEDASPLTNTEIEILKALARGLTAKEIAEARCSSVHTIVTHKKNIFRKLEISTVHEATQYALRAGIVNLIEYYI